MKLKFHICTTFIKCFSYKHVLAGQEETGVPGENLRERVWTRNQMQLKPWAKPGLEPRTSLVQFEERTTIRQPAVENV